MGERSIAVGEPIFVPVPLFGIIDLVQLLQSPGQFFAHLVSHPIAFKPAKIFVDADERKRPRAGTGGFENGGHCLFEQSSGHALKGRSV